MNKNLFYFILFYCSFYNNTSRSENKFTIKNISICSLIGFSSLILFEISKKAYNLINQKLTYNKIDNLLIKLDNHTLNQTAKPQEEIQIQSTIIARQQERFLSNSKINSEAQWESIFLSYDIKNELLDYVKGIFSLKNNNNDISLPNILCLYGLPGTNKTAIIKGLSNELNIPLLIIDPNLLDENIYNKISIESILDHVKNKGPCIIHIKNIERMSKHFFSSFAKCIKLGLNNPHILLTFSCNNDFLIKDLCLNKNKYIKFIIIDNPKFEERYKLIEYVLSLYKNLINTDKIDINHITNVLSSCKQKDITLILEKAIEKKQLIKINEIFDPNTNNKILLETNDIITEFKAFKKQDTIVTGENESQINTGLMSVNEFIVENPKVTFDEVIGLDHIKKELRFISDYLKNPSIYKNINIRMPKGILFKGPPGCGKTLMARAIAGEAGVTVISINGSDFIDKYVGQGARKVRELFEIAKIYGPTIIFIDEIDAIGGKRSSNGDGGEKEYTQTLNALLTEIDGFTSTNNNIIVIASTNRNIDDLDPALMRRFEEKYNFSLPTYKDRLKILKLYFKNVPISSDVSLEAIAFKTNSFSGAELEHLVNQSKYITINRMNNTGKALSEFEINTNDITQSYNTMSIGYEVLNTSINDKELFKTAVHESGHTLCMLLQENYPREFELVTITPRDIGDGTVLGFAQNFNKEEFTCFSKENLEQLIIVSFGGQVAEELILNESYNGVSSDLINASLIAKSMVINYGMADNLLYSHNLHELSILEREAIEKILKECKEKCTQLLMLNKDLLEILAKQLLIKKTLNRNEVLDIIALHNQIN